MLLTLQKYTYNVVYCPESRLVIADALSRAYLPHGTAADFSEDVAAIAAAAERTARCTANGRGLRRPGSHGLDELFVLVSKRYPGSLVVTSKGVSVDEQKSTSVEIFGLQVVKIKLIHYQFGNFENAKPTEIGLFTLTCSANLLHCFTRSGVCLQFCNVGLILISGHLATFGIIVKPRLSFCQICF